MGDYASAPSEVIAQCLVTVDLQTGAISFQGRGISDVVRTPGGQIAGDFTLTLDEGLPGDVAIDPPFGRIDVQMRGTAQIAAPIPGGTLIDEIAVDYIVSPTPRVGATQVRVVLLASGFPTDPNYINGDGFEFILWRGGAMDPNFQTQIVGGPPTVIL